MQYKSLSIGENLRENILYNTHSIPLSICIDHFDDYFHREWSCHWHDEFEFGVVLEGIVEYTIYDDQEHFTTQRLLPGDGIFISAECFHSAKGVEPGTIMAGIVFPIIFFDIKPFENIYQQNIHPVIESGVEYLILKKDRQADASLLSAIKELYTIDESEQVYELHCIEVVCKIWRLLTVCIESEERKIQIPASKRLQEQRLRKITSFIHTHFSEHISVDDMARAATISRTECFRCFRSVLGKKPAEYLNEYRLSMAAMLLANTDRTLSDISASCGFSTPSYFGKVFREQCGESPMNYRTKIHPQQNVNYSE